MKMIKVITIILLIFIILNVQAEENIRRIATWNMKWLGTNSGNQLDSVENVSEYVKYINGTKATLFALQEIGATHSVSGKPKCYYLDLIVKGLNDSISDSTAMWTYILDSINKNQRLAFLYRQDQWQVYDVRSIRPGKSYNHIRRPFIATVRALGDNAQLEFDYINIHLKAFPNATAKRAENLKELATWLQKNDLDEDVLISGDTNIYYGESGIDDPIKNIGYIPLYDAERTSIHEDKLGQRFDRFFVSPSLKNEVDSAKKIVGSKLYIDVIKNNKKEEIIWYDKNISDHYPVILNIDVSVER